MAYYRLYHIDHNRFVGVDEFEADDDAQALRQCAPLYRAVSSELWEGGRKIKTTFPEATSA